MGTYKDSRRGNMSKDLLLTVINATLSSLDWSNRLLAENELQINFPVNLWSFGETLKITISTDGDVQAECKGSSNSRNKKCVNTFINRLEKMYLIIEAKIKYQVSLEDLKNSPTNINSREKTLELGRLYSNLTNNLTGVTAFNELALMNDINAACAGGNLEQTSQKQNNSQTIEERLIILNNLKSNNLIDEQEYTARKQKIIDEI